MLESGILQEKAEGSTPPPDPAESFGRRSVWFVQCRSKHSGYPSRIHHQGFEESELAVGTRRSTPVWEGGPPFMTAGC